MTSRITKNQILAILNEFEFKNARQEPIESIEDVAINHVLSKDVKLGLAMLLSTKHEGFKEELASLMEEKNRQYGYASLNPKSIVNTLKITAKDSIAMRIDDKIARFNNTPKDKDTEDTIMDIIGYLVLYIHVMDV